MDERIAPGTVSSRNGAHRLVTGTPVQRVMFFGKNMSRTRCTGGLVDALESHGLQVKWRNMATLRRWLGNDRALRRARKEFATFRPDLVFVFCRDLPMALLREFRNEARVVIWIEDLLPEPDEALVEYLALADLVCMSALRHRSRLHEQGVENIVFLLSGFSPRFHFPSKPIAKVRDLVFIGGPGRQGQRARFLSELSKHFDTEIFGVQAGWERWCRHYSNLRIRRPVRNAGYRRVCATSRIVLGQNEANDVPLYFSNRTFLTLACGGFHLTHYVPELECLFRDGEHLAWFADEDECLDKIRHYLAADDERERIASSGHELVVGEHQYYHRVESILRIMTGQDAMTARKLLLPTAKPLSRVSLTLATGSR
jgi:hypothetical protein